MFWSSLAEVSDVGKAQQPSAGGGWRVQSVLSPGPGVSAMPRAEQPGLVVAETQSCHG